MGWENDIGEEAEVLGPPWSPTRGGFSCQASDKSEVTRTTHVVDG
jgi:hypothetical protein